MERDRRPHHRRARPPRSCPGACSRSTRRRCIDDEDIEDALGELANVVGGNVKAVLPGPSALGLPEVGVRPRRRLRHLPRRPPVARPVTDHLRAGLRRRPARPVRTTRKERGATVKILVADDSRVMRQIVIRTLRQAGYDDHDIVEAEDGADALAKVSSEKPDLVLSDWNMPNMTGIECLQAMRASGSAVPFGFVTSEGSPEMREKAANAGALFLIAKPFTEDTFKEHLDGVIA